MGCWLHNVRLIKIKLFGESSFLTRCNIQNFSYEMLSGYMAFDTDNDLEFTRKVTKNDWTMDLDRVQNLILKKFSMNI